MFSFLKGRIDFEMVLSEIIKNYLRNLSDLSQR